jgi:Fe2+ transport system protein FeoA
MNNVHFLKEELMQTLDCMKIGTNCIVEGFSGGTKFLSRICAMGFIPDAKITILSRYPFGPLLVALNDSEIALGRGEAQKIQVREV